MRMGTISVWNKKSCEELGQPDALVLCYFVVVDLALHQWK